MKFKRTIKNFVSNLLFFYFQKKFFFYHYCIGICCLYFSVSPDAQLIEPTRNLNEPKDLGFLNVLSEPPGIEVQIDGRVIGKTSVFSVELLPAVYILRIGDSETDIHIVVGKTTSISWFKGTFIAIPPPSIPAGEIPEEGSKPIQKTKPEKTPEVQNEIPKQPFYWPLNPHGPIFSH
jgi:hypothetical protein